MTVEAQEQPAGEAHDRNMDGAREFIDAILTSQQIWPNSWGQDVAAAAYFITRERNDRPQAASSPTGPTSQPEGMGKLTDEQINALWAKAVGIEGPGDAGRDVKVFARSIAALTHPSTPQSNELRDALANKERIELEHRRSVMSRHPFCPDHRDKVQGLSCRQCEIERLTAKVAALSSAVPGDRDAPTSAERDL